MIISYISNVYYISFYFTCIGRFIGVSVGAYVIISSMTYVSTVCTVMSSNGVSSVSGGGSKISSTCWSSTLGRVSTSWRAFSKGYITPLLLYLRYLIQKRSFHMDGVASLMEDSMNIKKKIMLDM